MHTQHVYCVAEKSQAKGRSGVFPLWLILSNVSANKRTSVRLSQFTIISMHVALVADATTYNVWRVDINDNDGLTTSNFGFSSLFWRLKYTTFTCVSPFHPIQFNAREKQKKMNCKCGDRAPGLHRTRKFHDFWRLSKSLMLWRQQSLLFQPALYDLRPTCRPGNVQRTSAMCELWRVCAQYFAFFCLRLLPKTVLSVRLPAYGWFSMFPIWHLHGKATVDGTKQRQRQRWRWWWRRPSFENWIGCECIVIGLCWERETEKERESCCLTNSYVTLVASNREFEDRGRHTRSFHK